MQNKNYMEISKFLLFLYYKLKIRKFDMKKFCIILVFICTSALAQDSNNLMLLEKINDLRISKGLDTLVYDESLHSVAQNWSKYILRKLRNYSLKDITKKHNKNPLFLHVNYDSRFDQVLKRNDINAIGENLNLDIDITDTSNVAQHSFNCWKKSKSHFDLMVGKDNTNFAFSYTYDKVKKRLLCILVISENLK